MDHGIENGNETENSQDLANGVILGVLHQSERQGHPFHHGIVGRVHFDNRILLIRFCFWSVDVFCVHHKGKQSFAQKQTLIKIIEKVPET